MAARMRYQGSTYSLTHGNWRGEDGHTVHFLTWVTDDLLRRGGVSLDGDDPDLVLALRVAETLGEEHAEVLEE